MCQLGNKEATGQRKGMPSREGEVEGLVREAGRGGRGGGGRGETLGVETSQLAFS